jgi:ribosomal protein S18 acetylase RimI-like enzyme
MKHNETMTYLIERVRALVGDHPAVTEKYMFGTLSFLLNGNMFVGCTKDGEILISVGKDFAAETEARSGVRPMILRGEGKLPLARGVAAPGESGQGEEGSGKESAREKGRSEEGEVMRIRAAETADVENAVTMADAAFAGDALMRYFFQHDWADAQRFFSILLRARLALAMPAYVLERDGAIGGLVMGYDISRQVWPAPLAAEWQQLEAGSPALAARLAAYDAISERYQPDEPHFYLGVIAVHPTLHRKGAGTALMTAFCERSRTDAGSSGVYLETGNRESLQFYLHHGFEIRGEGQLDTVPLWCLFKPT